MQSTEQKIERAALAGLAAANMDERERSTDISLAELAALVETAGGQPVVTLLQNKPTPDPRTFLGEGKVAELRELIVANDCDLAVFDNELSPSQMRVLEEELGVRVLDRSGLILDIFAQRAQTREGQLQVELAQYKYLLPRLSGMGTSLSRQGGGIGIRQLPCGGKAGLEVCAGGIKVLLGGNAANYGAVYFHLQGKVQVQPMGNHSPKYHPGGAGGKPWHQLPQRVRPGQRGAECLPQLQHRGKQQPDKIK